MSNRRHMLPLKSGHRKLRRRRFARSIRSGDSRRTVWRTAPCFTDLGQFGTGVGQANVDEPVMEQRRDKCKNSRLVTASRACAGKYACDLSHEHSIYPKAASLVPKISHLGRHVSKPCWRTEYERVVITKLLR